MIIVIENKDFIEGFFHNMEETEKYLLNHPQKDRCIIKDIMINEFPVYVIENGRGRFDYFSTKDEIVNYIKNIAMEKINKSKITTFYVDKNNETEVETREGVGFVIYKISTFFINKDKNIDTMGMWEHYHIEQDLINEIKNENKIDNLRI
jgi:hypothetical protein